MGFKLADLAMATQTVTGWTKAVLVIVALRADDKSGECYPSQKTIAFACGASVATVNRALDQLEAAGILRRSRRNSAAGYRTSDLITVDRTNIAVSQVGTEPSRQAAKLAVSKSLDITLQEPRYQGDSAERDHSIGHSEGHSDSLESSFDLFYEAYPRKQARAAALKAYKLARKTTDAETILAGARAFNLLTAGKERKYLPYPATWLNGHRWEDEPIEESPSTARTYRPTKDERALQILEMGRQLHSQSYGRPPRPSEAPPECPLHEGYSITPTSPCERCRRDQLSIPEGESF